MRVLLLRQGVRSRGRPVALTLVAILLLAAGLAPTVSGCALGPRGVALQALRNTAPRAKAFHVETTYTTGDRQNAQQVEKMVLDGASLGSDATAFTLDYAGASTQVYIKGDRLAIKAGDNLFGGALQDLGPQLYTPDQQLAALTTFPGRATYRRLGWTDVDGVRTQVIEVVPEESFLRRLAQMVVPADLLAGPEIEEELSHPTVNLRLYIGGDQLVRRVTTTIGVDLAGHGRYELSSVATLSRFDDPGLKIDFPDFDRAEAETISAYSGYLALASQAYHLTKGVWPTADGRPGQVDLKLLTDNKLLAAFPVKSVTEKFIYFVGKNGEITFKPVPGK